jgi:hypothetical protein
MGRFKHEIIPFLLKILIYAVVFSLAAGCGGAASKKTLYQQSDLEGSWKMNGFMKNNYGDWNTYGFVTIDTSGNILGGGATNFGIDKQQVSGGFLKITPEGSVTGTIDFFLPDTDTNQTQTVYRGQMAGEENVLVHASDFTVGRKGIGMLVKKNGSFTSSDLEGTWVFPLDGVFTVSLDSSGIITHCSYNSFKSSPEECNGNVTITPEGDIAGELETVQERPVKIWFEGQMPSSKNSMLVAGSISTRFGGMATLAIKRKGAFSSADITGTWNIFIAAYDDALYGTININSSGMVIGGDWKSIRGKAGTFKPSELSVTGHGDVSGILDTSTGDTYTLLGGQINPAMNLTGILGRDTAGRYGMVFLVRAHSR